MPQFWKEDEGHGFRVRYRVLDGSDEREADLVFVDDRPFAVLEWSEAGAAMVSVELDPAKLHTADPTGRVYDYSDTVKDPR